MSKRGIGYAVFGNPKSFEAKGVGLFNQIPSLASELYLGSSDFSLSTGGQVDALIGIQVKEFGPVCIWGRWAPAKGMDSERSGGWRGAAVIVSGMQPNWPSAANHLDELFQQISAHCDGEGRFRAGKDNWQIRFPELVESDLGTIPLGSLDGNSDRVAVAINTQGQLQQAVELAMSSLGAGVPAKWFFASPEMVSSARSNGAQFRAELGLPGLMRQFLGEMDKTREVTQRKGAEVQQVQKDLLNRQQQLDAKLAQTQQREAQHEEREKHWQSQKSQRQSELEQLEARRASLESQNKAAQDNLNQLRAKGGPAKQELLERENKGRALGEREGRAQERNYWIPRVRALFIAMLVLFIGCVTMGVLYYYQVQNVKDLKGRLEKIEVKPEGPGDPQPPKPAPDALAILDKMLQWQRSPKGASSKVVFTNAQDWRDLVNQLEKQLKEKHNLTLDSTDRLRLIFRYEKKKGAESPLVQTFKALPDSIDGKDIRTPVNELLKKIHLEPGFKEGTYKQKVPSIAIVAGMATETFEGYRKRILANEDVKQALKSWGLGDADARWAWEYCQLLNINDTNEENWKIRKGKAVKGFALVVCEQ